MGYFDSVKQRPLHVAPTPATVTPIRRDGIHPYAQAAIDAELALLDQCKHTPIGHPPHWDTTTYKVACNLIELANSPWSGYTHTQARADLDNHAPRDAGFDQRRIDQKWASAESKIGSAGRPEPTGQTTPAATVLDVPDLDSDTEAVFWSARDELTHIHTFARARRVSPWAVLGVTLARVVTAVPPHVVLPPIVGGKASLNLFVGLVGRSGTGKGAAEAVAAEAVNVGEIESHKTGSGEGIAHGYMRREKGEVIQHTTAVLFSVPEIDTLSALGARQGATLLPELRSAWSGERLGFGYADPTKRLPVPAHQYRLCLVAGIQPARARTLLDDADGGTPQRFLWMPATDPAAPDTPPECPAPLRWTEPDTRPVTVLRQPSGALYVDVCAEARRTIDRASLARTRGETDALDGHALLCRLKAAAALAALSGRLEVTDDDWHLAGLVQRKSDATRATVQHALSAANRERLEASAQAEGKRQVIVTQVAEDAATKRVAKIVVRKLRRVEGDWVAQSEVRKAVASRDRPLFEEALERLEEAGLVEVSEGESRFGRGSRIRLIGESK